MIELPEGVENHISNVSSANIKICKIKMNIYFINTTNLLSNQNGVICGTVYNFDMYIEYGLHKN